MRADYKRGAITPEDWYGLKPELEEEHVAAQARLAQLRERESEVEEAAARTDEVENDAVARLAAIQAAIAGQVTDAQGIEAVRIALRRAFEAFYVYRVDAFTTPTGEEPEFARLGREASRARLLRSPHLPRRASFQENPHLVDMAETYSRRPTASRASVFDW